MGSLPFMEPIHILGSGSIGLFWAASIRSAFPSYPLAVLFRQHHKDMVAGEGSNEIMVCMRQNGRPRMAHIPAQLIGNDGAKQRPIRNLILSTKAYQARNAVQSIVPRLDRKNLRIMILCNGALDVRERLIDMLLQYDIHNPELVMCTTTNGVYQDQPDENMFHLVHVGHGRTFMGGMPTLAQLWDQSGLNAKVIEPGNMEVLLWQKLAANCVCNPLTTLWEIPNGELSKRPSFASLREQVVKEVSEVGQALNPELCDQLSPAALDGFVEQVVQENLQNKSSMFYDVKKKQKTEVENLNGYIKKKGLKFSIDTPANNELLDQIQEITARYIDEIR